MSKKKLYLVMLGAGAAIAGALIAVGILSAGGGPAKPSQAAATSPAVAGVAETRSLFAGIPQNGAVLGAANAPVTLVEYADPQCPYCKQWALGALPTIVRDYVRPGRIRIEFRPLAFVGPESKAGVTALLAAGMRGQMWQTMHLLYANQGAENSGWINDNLVGAVIAKLGLGWPQFEYDRYSGKVARAMHRSEQAAVTDGIQGTPSFFAGRTGQALQPLQVSSLDADAMRPMLDQLLGA
jgi:protein-disulfide isomerase